jgi:transcriptional regulator with XRE-family HTH domain
VAAKTDKGHRRKTEQMYDAAVVSLENILLRGLKSIRSEHFSRKEFANRLGLKVQSLINIERGHRNLLAAELFLLSFAMNKNPYWIVQEILRRFEDEIGQWRKEADY